MTPLQEIGARFDAATNPTQAFTGDVVVGSLVVVWAWKDYGATDPFVLGDVSQSAGSAVLTGWQLDRAQEQNDAGEFTGAAIWSAIVQTAGPCTIQLATPAGTYGGLVIGEYDGSWDATRVEDSDVGGSTADSQTAAATAAMTSAGAALFAGALAVYGSGNLAPLAADSPWVTIASEPDNSAHAAGSAIRQIVGSGTTDAAGWTFVADNRSWSAVGVVYKEAAGGGATADQEGARFGNDDGSESAHTFAAAQDANITSPLSQNLLLRALIDGTGDLASAAYTLRAQKNGAGGYAAVPVGASFKTTPLIESGDATVTTVGSSATPWAINFPAAAAGDMLIAIVAWDDSVAVTSVTPPAGPNSEAATSIQGPAASSGTEMRIQAWRWIATGTWSATTRNFTPAAAETCRAVVIKVLAGEFDPTTPIGASSNSVSAGTAESNVNSPAFSAGATDGSGRLIIGFGSDADAITAPASGTTTVNNATGGGVGLCVSSRNAAVTDSESIAAVTATIASDSWATVAFVVRAPTTVNELYVSPSANIAAGGEATTARLTAPSGKSGTDFVAGRRWDDENGADSIDIAVDDYTEVEWCLQAQSPAANGDFFDFRVYAGAAALATYGVTPRWTIGTPVTPSLPNPRRVVNRRMLF